MAGIVWCCAGEGEGIPGKQTLERVVCVALSGAEPGQGASVSRWLADEPHQVGPVHKAHALSYLAKWYAEFGFEAFYQRIWEDDALAAQLESLLGEDAVADVRDLVA